MYWKHAWLICAIIFILSGCATLPTNFERKSTYALSNSQQTTLGKKLSPHLQAHPGQSGFYLLHSNLEAFAARMYTIYAAEKTLDVQYYLFHADTSGRLIANALLKAADRGVRVRLLLDDIDTADKSTKLAALNKHANIEIRLFNPFANRGKLRALNYLSELDRVGRRMHNKSLIADNIISITGGRNIGDEYFSARSDLAFADTDIVSIGPIVSTVSNSFDAYWNSQWALPVAILEKQQVDKYTTGLLHQNLNRFIEYIHKSEYIQAVQRSNLVRNIENNRLDLVWAHAEFFYDSPDKITASETSTETKMTPKIRPHVEQANERVLIVSPYFVPGKNGVKFFKSLRDRGVEVSILTNSLASTDVVAVHAGYARYREELLSMGVKLYEMKPSAFVQEKKKNKWLRGSSRASLHAKLVIVDQQIALIGSANMDPRSRDLNTETAMMIHSPELSWQVEDFIDRAIHSENSYSLSLTNADDEDETQMINWTTKLNGNKKVYQDEPEADFWRMLQYGLFSLLPIEGLL
jgi:putative cardiolipin synthase